MMTVSKRSSGERCDTPDYTPRISLRSCGLQNLFAALIIPAETLAALHGPPCYDSGIAFSE